MTTTYIRSTLGFSLNPTASNPKVDDTVFIVSTDPEVAHTAMTQYDMEATLNDATLLNETYDHFEYIVELTISPDIVSLADYLFTHCINLKKITIHNTDVLKYIGKEIFVDVSANGTYTFGSASNYKTLNISNLISQLPPTWVPDITYNIYTNFAKLSTNLIELKVDSNAIYYNLTPINIPYADFHTLFFPNNGYFTLNINNYGKYKINPTNLLNYITINLQTQQIYLNDDLTLAPIDIRFNLLSSVLNHYQYNMSSQCWSIESTIQINRQLSSLKTIFNFQEKCGSDRNYKEEDCHCQRKCNNDNCREKNKTKITIDDFFNMYEAQGIAMGTDNSYNTFTSTPISAIGLPFDAYTTRYTAILTLYLRSNNSNVSDIGFKMPYLIDFSNSMPKNANPNTNNYRSNPYF